MRKGIILCTVICIACLAGCHPTEGLHTTEVQTDAYTYHLENGDLIQIEIESDKGYTIDAEDPFIITQDDENVAMGIFMPGDIFESYRQIASMNEEGLSLIEEGTEGENEYIFYSVEEDGKIVEWDYMTLVNESSTAVVVGSDYSEETARAVYRDITFSFGGVEEVEEDELKEIDSAEEETEEDASGAAE